MYTQNTATDVHVPALYFALNIPQIYPQQRVYDRFMAVRWYIDRASKEIEQFDITVTHVGIYRYIIYARER